MADVYGGMSGQEIGAHMLAIVRHAIAVIREHIHDFTVEPKPNGDDADDCTTSADRAAQVVYVDALRATFPHFGIVAEEDNLRIPCDLTTNDCYFTVDPLDGSKAFARRETRGVGTMIALVMDGRVVAAVVGDINTQEVVCCVPGAGTAHLHPPPPHEPRVLAIDPTRLLRTQMLLLRERRDGHSAMHDILNRHHTFAETEVLGGSVGVGMIPVWTGAVSATVLRANQQMPWDLAPIVGISQRLGFVFLRPAILDGVPTGDLELFYPPIVSQQYRTVRETLVVHRSRLDELRTRGLTIRSFE